MPDTGEHTVEDPRRTDGATLDVEFEIESYGSSGNGWDDDGEPPEISLTAARDVTGANVLDLLTDEQRHKIHGQIVWEYDWSPPEDYGGYDD